MTLITFLLLGLGNGAVFAALGVSLAISYRTSNVVNFGVGSMALFGAVIYETVRTQQAIFNPFAAASVLVYIFIVIAVVVLAIRWVRPGRPPLWRMGLTAAVVAGIAILGFQPTLLDIGTNLSTAAGLVVACRVERAVRVRALRGRVPAIARCPPAHPGRCRHRRAPLSPGARREPAGRRHRDQRAADLPERHVAPGPDHHPGERGLHRRRGRGGRRRPRSRLPQDPLRPDDHDGGGDGNRSDGARDPPQPRRRRQLGHRRGRRRGVRCAGGLLRPDLA